MRKHPSRPRAAPAPDPLAGKTVQLRIDLRHSKPPIWRRLLVPGDIRLDRLHDVIQIAMGWTNSHLHAFRKGGHDYTMPDLDDPGWQDTPGDVTIDNESKHTLADLVAAEGNAFQYDYDFGDGWEHDVRVEKIEPATERPLRARCLAGKLACPLEDSGGLYGYYDKLRIIANPKHPEHGEMAAWVGEEFDPKRFDLDEVNALLARVRM